MKRRMRSRGGTGGRRAARVLSGIAVMLLVVVFVDTRIRPVVENMLEYQARVFAFQVINSAMLEELEREGVDYDDLVRLTRAEDGTVSSVQTNVQSVNRIKTRMADTVARQVESTDSQTLYIPIGTLLGSPIVSGRGPQVEVRVIPIGYVQSDLYNQFTSAGINQTLHQVMLKTSVQMIAVMPGFSVRTETSTSFCIAETVIVGAIPDGYTIVNGDERSAISKINDYGAE